ncbi:hypothetical protein IPG41_02910 [Candidatus Peregrinibacteria bacterium]|nr:MAG: hypothetical protein IPG41_02910 [Candidatus Peregrinibacteria bacterium]
MSKKYLLLFIPVLLIAMFVSMHFNLLERLRIAYTFAEVASVTAEGDMGWGEDVLAMIEGLKADIDDKDLLMNQMLSSEDGTIAAEGMALAFERIQDREQLLNILAPYDFENDKRWNYFVYTNDLLYRDLLVAAKIRAGMELTEEEEISSDMSIIYAVFGVDY